MTIYSEIEGNKQKTILFFVLFLLFSSAVVYFIGKAMGYSGENLFLFAFGFSFVTSFFSYFFSDSIVLAMHGAVPADRKQFFDLYTVTENLALAAGIPKPRVYVIRDASPNAFATGRDLKHSVVVATTGILELLNRKELEGVIAHELSHIRNYDMLLMTIVSVLVGSIVFITDIFTRSLWFQRDDREEKGSSGVFMIIGIVLALISPLIATLIQLAISRKREFLADASGAYLTRYPEGLASALRKISQNPYKLHSGSNATAHLFIANPFKADVSKTSWLVNLFSTHPAIEERIAKLEAM